MPHTEIPVPEGIIGHHGPITKVVLREPTMAEFLDIGDVTELVIYPNGMRIPTVNPVTLRRYLEACLIEPKGDLLVLESQGTMKLGKAMRDTVLGFFQDEPTSTGDPSAI